MTPEPGHTAETLDELVLPETPTGPMVVRTNGTHVVRVTWLDGVPTTTGDNKVTPLLADARDQLLAYFEGKRRTFDLPLDPQGSAHQLAVWQVMQTIPHGETRTYGWLANQIGSHARAVGSACGANPIPVIIPCHRVMGASGKLTGFSGGRGVETKRQLLDLEQPKLF